MFATMRIVLVEGDLEILNYTAIFNTRVSLTVLLVASLGAFIYLFSVLRDEHEKEEFNTIKKIALAGINGIVLWLISIEIIDFFKVKASKGADVNNIMRASLSIAWTLYAIVMLVIGILKRSGSARKFSIFLFGVVIFKVFLYDTASLDDFYRFVSFISLGVILLLSGFLYYRFKERIYEFISSPDDEKGIEPTL